MLFNLKTINKEFGDLEQKETFKSFFKEIEILNIAVFLSGIAPCGACACHCCVASILETLLKLRFKASHRW